jgi:hypothetical protein
MNVIDTDKPLLTEEMLSFLDSRNSKPVSRKRKKKPKKHSEEVMLYLIFKTLENKVDYYREELVRLKETNMRPENLSDYEIQRLVHEHRLVYYIQDVDVTKGIHRMNYHLTELGDLILGVVLNQKPEEADWLQEMIREICG